VEKYGDKLFAFYNEHHPLNFTASYNGLTFAEFMEMVCEGIISRMADGTKKMLSIDRYPIFLDNRGDRVTYTDFLYTIECVALAAKKYGIPETHFCIQSAEHMGRPVMTEEDLRWQFYTYMAYGGSAFTYYTYRDLWVDFYGIPSGSSMVSKTISCRPHPLYYGAQKVNAELQSMAQAYLNFEWIGTMPVTGTANDPTYAGGYGNYGGLREPLESIPFINRYQSTQDALFGQFKDKDGRDGLIITNFTLPSEELTSNVKIEFKNAKKAAVYMNGKEEVYILRNGVFEIKLKPSEGAFVIPLA